MFRVSGWFRVSSLGFRVQCYRLLGFGVLSWGIPPYPGVPKRSRSCWRTLWSTARPGATTTHCQRILINLAANLTQLRNTNGDGSGMKRHTSLLAAVGMALEQCDFLSF